MSNKIINKTGQNAFTDEIEDIFKQKQAIVNVFDAKIVIEEGSMNGYGKLTIEGTNKINVDALNKKMSNHKVANIKLVDKKKAELQIAP